MLLSKKLRWMAGILVYIQLFGPVATAEKTSGIPDGRFEQEHNPQSATAAETLRINLEQAIQIALSDNPTIIIADQEIKRIDYTKKETWYALIPTLNASAQISKYMLPAKMSMFGMIFDTPTDFMSSTTLSMSLPLVVPALWRSIQMTELQMQMANEQAHASKINLRNEVVKAYYQILLAQDSYETLQDGYGLAKQNYEEAKQRFELGLAAEYDYIFAEVQMQNLLPTILQVENGITLSKSFLKVLMGVDLAISLIVEGKLIDFENRVNMSALTNPLSVSLDRNSDLMQLDIQQKQLQKQMQLQRTQRLPTLVGFGQYGYSGVGTKDATINLGGLPMQVEARKDWFSTGLIFGMQLNVPIFNGYTNKMKEKKIEVSAKTLSIQRDYVKDNLTLQVSAAIDNMAKAVEQMEAGKKGVQLAEKGYAISQERYNNDMGTMLELRSASQSLTQAKLAYNQAIVDYLAAKADYEKIIGQY